jgi:hypothetical protein
VTTGAATNLTSTTATLNATVNPNGLSTTVQFVTDFGFSSTQDAGNGTSNVSLSVDVTGLAPGTQYHFNASASNAGGITQGTQQAFTTLPGPAPTPTATVTPTPTPTPASLPTLLAQISTRLKVEAGDNALFGGFIITGSQPKRLMIRAIGPTVPVTGNLQNPTLELFSGSTSIGSNDNWVDAVNKQEMIDSGIAPTSEFEAAILTSLAPGAYSAFVRGLNDTNGVGLVEVYDLDQAANSKLAQISTRGFVQPGDDAMFGGFFVSNGSLTVIIRAIGPSTGLSAALQDPTLELYDGNGAQLTANDNWVDSADKQAIIDTTVAPTSDFESAIVRALAPGPYTAIVRGTGDSAGIALVEVYALN